MVENRALGRQVIEAMIQALRPHVCEFSWAENVSRDTYLLSMTGRLRLRIDQGAVDQAADQENAHTGLRMKIEEALQMSESGSAIGFVTQA